MRRGTEVALCSLIALVFWTLIELAVITMTNPSTFRTVAIKVISSLQKMFAFTLLCFAWIWVVRALAYFISMALYVGEFIVRRIAEYPKGPVLAVSAFFGGIVALFKAFR